MFKKRRITAHSQRPTTLADKKEALDRESEKESLNGSLKQSPVVKPTTSARPSEEKSKVEALPTVRSKREISEIEDDLDEGKQDPTDEDAKSTIGVFNGKINVANFLTPAREPTTNKFGPLKASAHIRSTTMTDYAPDVCKDYKQTGFCGYGDTCKFLHIREDYAAGWKIDKEWEIKQTAVTEPTPDESVKKEPEIPSECPICSKPYKSPVVTSCGHFFCESCFLSEFRKSGTCFTCQAKMSGTVKPAGKLLKEKLSKQKPSSE